MLTSEFHYGLPEKAIAQRPIEPRHAARLLVASTLDDRTFSDLPRLLEPADLVVVNETRVRPGRLRGFKRVTGGAVEALLLRPIEREGGSELWQALLRPARRVRRGTELVFGDLSAVPLDDPVEGRATLRIEAASGLEVEEVLEKIGALPLPPYVRGRLEDPDRYQTIFAASVGSAAAPTAGLHVTTGVLEGFRRRGIRVTAVDLEIGLDTFRPISAERVEDHRVHSEAYEVPETAAAAIAATRGRGGRVVALGTTVVRALETVARPDGTVTAGRGTTDLFIIPGYRFRVVDVLVTNFHVPGSSLVVLVAAFMGRRWRGVYRCALERGYRFLSFGDAMLAERAL
ncbi:MAG: tRNA preQ1(34) S-adenosylmethionine ribosyltransferase-isomerase QueA [Acidimicrobiia bacterium]